MRKISVGLPAVRAVVCVGLAACTCLGAPEVRMVLKSGHEIRATLKSLKNGKLTVVQNGKERTFNVSRLQRIEFPEAKPAPPPEKPEPKEVPKPEINTSVKRLRSDLLSLAPHDALDRVKKFLAKTGDKGRPMLRDLRRDMGRELRSIPPGPAGRRPYAVALVCISVYVDDPHSQRLRRHIERLRGQGKEADAFADDLVKVIEERKKTVPRPRRQNGRPRRRQ